MHKKGKKIVDGQYNTFNFSSVGANDWLPLITTEIETAKAEINAIAHNPQPPTFENTIEALEFSGELLDRLSSAFFNLNSAETNDTLQAAAQQISPMLSEFGNDIRLNKSLFKRVKSVYQQRKTLNLSEEQKTLLNKKYKNFTRNGANLSKAKKEQLRQLDKELAKLTLKFGENVLAETNKYELHITKPEELSGLPEGTVEAAAQEAKTRNKQGWVFTLNYPSYIPFITYADNRQLRKQLYLAFGCKGFNGDSLDNREIIKQITTLRHQRANLLGYPTHAHFVLEERMAKTPETVTTFLNDLLAKAKPAAEKEFTKLQEFAKKLDGIGQLEKWDGAYYTEKLKQQLFNLDDEKLKPYFKLENVIDGVFMVSKKLFGLNFQEITNIEKYHEDVKTYRVSDENGNYISILYADFHPRPGKRNGAWMTSFKNQWVRNKENSRPHISIVCNFTKPTPTKPSLLTFNEVTTLFHEFGHALHGMLANTVYPSLSGTSVHWDFVELPSQLLENWCYEPEALSLFAKHYQTGEIIPSEYIERIKQSSNFMEGMQTLRQLSFGLLDMGWHGADPSTVANVKQFEKSIFSKTDLYPDTPETCMSTSFSHIFQGGYSAGYYSYKWAEVLDADAFEHFKQHGIFSQKIAQKFKEHVLSKGGTENPMDLYKRFRGRKPRPEALLKRAGLAFNEL